MKKTIISLLMGTIFSIPSFSYGEGGHAEGGGDLAATTTRDAKIIIQAARYKSIQLVQQITPNMFVEYGAAGDGVALYRHYRELLIVDLKGFSFKFYDHEQDRDLFKVIEDEKEVEKSALTAHEPGAVVKINLLHLIIENKLTEAKAVALLWREAGRHVIKKNPNDSDEAHMRCIEPLLDQLEELAFLAQVIFKNKGFQFAQFVDRNGSVTGLTEDNFLEAQGLMLTPAGKKLLEWGLIYKKGGPKAVPSLISIMVGGAMTRWGWQSLPEAGRLAHEGVLAGGKMDCRCPPDAQSSQLYALGRHRLSQTFEGRLLLRRWAIRKIVLVPLGLTIAFLPMIVSKIAVAPITPQMDTVGMDVKRETYRELIETFNQKILALEINPDNLLIQREVLVYEILQLRAAIALAEEEADGDVAALSQQLSELTIAYDDLERTISALDSSQVAFYSNDVELIEQALERDGGYDFIHQQLAMIL